MNQCANCGTQWTIHKLGIVPAKKQPNIPTDAEQCLGEYCPGCRAWLDVEQETPNGK